MVRYCIICGRGGDRPTTLFSVPKDVGTRQDWQLASGRVLKIGSFVCANHFHPKYIVRNTLRRGALPSVCTQSPNGKTQDMKRKNVDKQKYIKEFEKSDTFLQTKQPEWEKVFIKMEETHENEIDVSDTSEVMTIKQEEGVSIKQERIEWGSASSWEDHLGAPIDCDPLNMTGINCLEKSEIMATTNSIKHEEGVYIKQEKY